MLYLLEEDTSYLKICPFLFHNFSQQADATITSTGMASSTQKKERVVFWGFDKSCLEGIPVPFNCVFLLDIPAFEDLDACRFSSRLFD